MTGEEFLELYLHNTELRQYIVDLVKAYTSDTARRTHLLCHAWMTLAESGAGKTQEYYYGHIYSAIRREWECKYIYDYEKKKSHHPATRRANRYLKKITSCGD